MNKKIIITSAVLLILPTLALAFDPGPSPGAFGGDFNGLIQILLDILWPVAVAFFIVMFVIAGFLFATARGEPEQVKKARDAVIYGIVGVVVALIAFSIVTVIKNRVGV